MAAAVEEFNGFYIRLPSIQRLSFTTLSVLHTLARRSPLRLGELTATEQVTQSAITQVVTRLENDGLVERRPDPRDGRAVLVHITPGGAEVVAARHADRVARLAPILRRLSAEERSTIAAALPALRRIAEPRRLRERSARTSMTDFPLTPTPIQVPDDVLADLQRRLTLTRWPVDAGNDDCCYGVNRTYLQELVEYWRDEYDWRAAEAAINAYEHYRVEVGRRAGALHAPGPASGPDPTPLILTHGWPWTFWHWSKVIDPLADPGAYGGDPADAFDVIVPSLPRVRVLHAVAGPPGHELLEDRRPLAHADDRRRSATSGTPPPAAMSARW